MSTNEVADEVGHVMLPRACDAPVVRKIVPFSSVALCAKQLTVGTALAARVWGVGAQISARVQQDHPGIPLVRNSERIVAYLAPNTCGKR